MVKRTRRGQSQFSLIQIVLGVIVAGILLTIGVIYTLNYYKNTFKPATDEYGVEVYGGNAERFIVRSVQTNGFDIKFSWPNPEVGVDYYEIFVFPRYASLPEEPNVPKYECPGQPTCSVDAMAAATGIDKAGTYEFEIWGCKDDKCEKKDLLALGRSYITLKETTT